MAQATVKTVQYLDPRIEPQPDPVYDYVIGPTQNQYYRIPASGFSQSSITFNNLTSLGIDRAYLDTFELELSATILFEVSKTVHDADIIVPALSDWTFQSFPFNTCCEEARVNINGGAFFSQPMCYVRAKERYMNQYELSKSYQNICPVHRPETQYESGRRFDYPCTKNEAATYFLTDYRGYPGRYGAYHRGYMPSSEGIIGGDNMSFIDYSADSLSTKDYPPFTITKKQDNGKYYIVVGPVVWREPIFVSPFSSRYDATYGRPLYNITSMDLAFNLCSNLGNMIRVNNWQFAPVAGVLDRNAMTLIDYSVHLDTACLCYQVMTIPPILNKPLTTLVPYRRFVPYITEYNKQGNTTTTTAGTVVNIHGDKINMSSGVYTFNEIPTAIWVFVAPVKSRYQTNDLDFYRADGGTQDAAATADDVNAFGNWDSNKLFGFLKKVNISMANTTQILATAKPSDLYRIAKANGCEDSAQSWLNAFPLNTSLNFDVFTMAKAVHGVDGTGGGWSVGDDTNMRKFTDAKRTLTSYTGAGSVLRLKPGVDIIVPDQPLIPGANANNMVFQVEVDAVIPPNSLSQVHYALWLLFEYVGVAAISPGQCEITMNPLGSGEIMAVSPVMSATSESTEGNLEGSGFWDNAKKHTKILGQLADDGIISMILKRIPGAQGAAEWAKKHGLGEPACKRGRGGAVSGGAVIGKGLNDWV